ncbi:hypothetical protein Tco_0161505 [Tanacetum coccineum]
MGNESFQEEHYISKLKFTWPQVACLFGYPARGSKVVFMSYKDRVGQIHKFSLRFATLYETERFINSVKEFFGHEKIDGSMSGISITKTSSQSEIIPRAPPDVPEKPSATLPPQNEDLVNSSVDFSQPMYRLSQNEDPVNSSAYFSQPMYSPIASIADTCIQSMQPSENHNGSQISNPLEVALSQDVQGKLSAFPLSFTSLLMDCFPVAEQEMQSTVPEEVALKKEIMKYLEDSSFHVDMSQIQTVGLGANQDYLVTVPCSCHNVNNEFAYFYETLYLVKNNDTFFDVSNEYYSGQAWPTGDECFQPNKSATIHLLCGCTKPDSQVMVTYTVQ